MLTIPVNLDSRSFQNMLRCLDLEPLPEWKFQRLIHKYPMILLYHLQLDRVPTTTSQLARYVTTIANKGTLFDLTLLNKTTDVKGNVIEESQPKIDNTLSDISASTWDAVHEGMRNVVLVSHSSTFSDINRSGFQLSGKTGTAQQSKTHPDHALFIGFAPSDSPEVAFATRIANGYSSTYAAEVARDVMKYYYQLTPENELITGTASSIGSNASNEG